MGKNKNIVNYTKEEKREQLYNLMIQIYDMGLGSYQDEIKTLGARMLLYQNFDQEFDGEIPLPGSKRILVCNFKNNKRIPISINVKYDKNI